MAIDERLIKLREDVFKANIELFKSGLVMFTFGNVSGIDRKSRIIAIKPSGVEYSRLKPENMVLLDLDGNKFDGKLNASSDARTHIELYKAFEDIGGIVHTHSRYATSWAQAKKSLPCLGTTHADYFYGSVPCTDVISDNQIKSGYEKETGLLIIETFKKRKIDYRNIRACLVACHGPFTWGASASEAVEISIILEDIARMNFISMMLNKNLNDIKKKLLEKHYLRKHGKDAYYGQKK
jgi:L-ribulose-5-phosphate 4-epimerase